MDTISTDQSAEGGETRGLLPLQPRVSMISYRVADIERSLRFYVGVLGMTELARFPGFGPEEHELVLEYPGTHGAAVMLMWNSARSHPHAIGDGYNRFTITVRDARAALAHLVERAAPVVVPVTEANGCLFAVVQDPDGYMVELLQLLRA